MNTLAEAIKSYLEFREEISSALRSAGRNLVTRLTVNRSLREISRLSGLSPTYLSMVKNGNAVISPQAYLTLSELEDSK